MFSIRFKQCHEDLDGRNLYELAENEFLIAHNLAIDEFAEIIAHINAKISPYRKQLILMPKVLLYYVFGGSALFGFVAFLFDYFTENLWTSIAILGIFFLILGGVIRFTIKRTSWLEKSVHINLAIILINFTREVLRPKYGMEARVGYKSEWVEFHSIKLAADAPPPD